MISAFVIYTAALAIMVHYYIGRYKIYFLQSNFCLKEEHLSCFWVVLIFFLTFRAINLGVQNTWPCAICVCRKKEYVQCLKAFAYLLVHLMSKMPTTSDIIFGALKSSLILDQLFSVKTPLPPFQCCKMQSCFK